MTLLAVVSCSPPRRCLDGKPELTETPRLHATAAKAIPQRCHQAQRSGRRGSAIPGPGPERVRPVPKPAGNPEELKKYFLIGPRNRQTMRFMHRLRISPSLNGHAMLPSRSLMIPVRR